MRCILMPAAIISFSPCQGYECLHGCKTAGRVKVSGQLDRWETTRYGQLGMPRSVHCNVEYAVATDNEIGACFTPDFSGQL